MGHINKVCPICGRYLPNLVFWKCSKCKRYVCGGCFIAKADGLPLKPENFLCRDCLGKDL